MPASPRPFLSLLASGAALALLAGCQAPGGLSSEELAASVAAMTHGDVTRPAEGEAAGPRDAVDLSQGYRAALRTAILENQAFAASVRRYRGADAGIRVAQSATRPQIDSSATLGGIVEGGDVSDSDAGAAGNITLSQLIYDGGRTRADIAGATARAYAARANVAVAGNEVGRDAALAWNDLWQANARIALLRDQIDEVSPLVERIEQLISNGLIDRAVLAAAKRQFLDLKLEEETLTAALRDAQERFNRYYRDRPRSVSAPPRLLSEAELARTSRIWPDSPALIAAAAELISAERAVAAAQAELRPTLSLRTGASSPLGETDAPNFNAGLVLQYTFGDGGRRKAEIERLDEDLQAGRARFEDTKSETRVEVDTTLSRHRALRQSLAVVKAQIEELDVERKTLRSQITSGQSDMRRLVEAEILYYRARSRHISLRGDIAELEITLASLTGQLTEKLDIKIDNLL